MGLTQSAGVKEQAERERQYNAVAAVFAFWRRQPEIFALARWIYEKFKSLFVVRECERAHDASVGLVYGVVFVALHGTYVCRIFTAAVALFQLC
jgi:hypothetical protein